MALEPVTVRIKLDNIACYHSGEPGSAEPYMWTVFFKIDGDTVSVDDTLTLQGTATVFGSLGDHGDLGPGGVNDGDTVSIPAGLGDWSTTLTPIPVPSLSISVAGVVGCVVVMLEQDDTSDEAVAAGHAALNEALQSALNDLITHLNINHPSPTDADIQAYTDQVGGQAQDAISNNVSVWDWLTALGNMDDKIGTAVFYQSQTALCRAPVWGFALDQLWEDSGEWRLSGHMGAVIDELEVSCIHKPEGRDDAHHIDTLGGTVFGVDWRLSNIEVIRAIQGGFPFFVTGGDGSRSQLVVEKHWISTENPTGLFLATTSDASKADNLLSLPTCGPLS